MCFRMCSARARWQVRITNPLDAPLETLGLPPERADGLEVSYDADEGVLTLTVTPELLTGCAHCFEACACLRHVTLRTARAV